MTKKLFLLGVTLLMLLFTHAFALAAVSNQPAIELDNAKIEAAAYNDGGNVYLPLRAVGEALGYKVQWSGKENTISLSKTGKNIVVDLKNYTINANDHTYYMSGEYSNNVDKSATTAGNITYMRADFFSDNLAIKVHGDKINEKVKLDSIEENEISIKTIKEASETDKIDINLQYPQIEGLDDKTVQDSINSVFKQAAEDARQKGLENADEMKEVITSRYTGNPIKCETYFNYLVKYNQNGLLSVVCTDYQFTGGAHGSTVQSSYTFNLDTGEEYRLKDLFKNDADYVSLINDNVRQEINERLLSESLITPFKTISNDEDYYLSGDAVVVYFQQYEYFPYAAGIQEFPVDFSNLQDILSPNFDFLQ